MTTPVRERLFALAWRATLFLLPCQARFIAMTPLLNGFPWEQGTFAFYLSWIPLIATIALSWDVLRAQAHKASLRAIVLVPVVILLLSSFFTASRSATMVWWMHVVLLSFFVAALRVHRVTLAQIVPWLVYSLIPHVALGLMQFVTQTVRGSTLLGIAEQISWKSGVSVVEYGEYRVLRAYGGFPHPNVFAGWLAVALSFFPWLVARAKTTLSSFAWMVCGAFFLFVLILTFSRGAWIAAFVGIVAAFVLLFRNAHDMQKKMLSLAAFIFVATITVGVVMQWDAVTTRFGVTERLERWSLTQRVDAIQDGMKAFRQHPVFGWGPGAALVGVGVVRTAAAPVPLEPPHVAPFVILMETGILGLAAVLTLAWFFLRSLITEKRWIAVVPLLSVFAVLALTDHYLWTLWAGKVLLMLGFLLLVLEKRDRFSASK